jgi:tRNA(Ile)-lysidine synthase
VSGVRVPAPLFFYLSPMNNPLKTPVQSLLSQLAPDQKIGVAFSGGRDSAALAHAIWQTPRQSHLHLVYINHQLRQDAASEEAFVRTFAKKYAMNLSVYSIRIEDDKNIEATARALRYDKLREWHEAQKGIVVTAHHFDDQVETILYRVVSGTGINGLRAIHEHRDFIRRPLLSVTREEIDNYCEQYRVPHYEDSSNADTGFKRNAIRHQILPLINTHFGSQSSKNIVRLQEALAAHFSEYDRLFAYYLARGEIWVGSDNARIEAQLHDSQFTNFMKYVYERVLAVLNISPNLLSETQWLAIRQYLSSDKLRLDVNKHFFLYREKGYICLQTKSKPPEISIEAIPAAGLEVKWLDWCISFSWIKPNRQMQPDNMNLMFDAKKLSFPLLLQAPDPGVKIRKAFNHFDSEVRKVLAAGGLNRFRRNRVPMLMSADTLIGGPWVGVADAFKATAQSRNVLKVVFQQVDHEP